MKETIRGYGMQNGRSQLSSPVYEYILQQILNKKLRPGDRIPETRVAKEFGISRTPVRDATKKLANEGILEVFPNRCIQVKVYNEDDITKVGTLRAALDVLAIKLAALYGSKADFLHLLDIAKQCSEAARNKDFAIRTKLDCDFHLYISEISKSEILIKYQQELYLRVRYIIAFNSDDSEKDKFSINQHIQIAEALLEGNEELAKSLVVEHLSSFYNLSSKYPAGFFTDVTA